MKIEIAKRVSTRAGIAQTELDAALRLSFLVQTSIDKFFGFLNSTSLSFFLPKTGDES